MLTKLNYRVYLNNSHYLITIILLSLFFFLRRDIVLLLLVVLYNFLLEVENQMYLSLKLIPFTKMHAE